MADWPYYSSLEIFSHLLWGDAELGGEDLLLPLVGVGVLLVALEPGVEAVVDVLREAGVLDAELVLEFDGAGVLLAELVAHAGAEADGGRGLAALGLRPRADELLVEALLPEAEQLHFDVLVLAETVVLLWR